MPPRKISASFRHRSHLLASSAEEQEAVIKKWREKALQDEEKFCQISSKVIAQKKTFVASKREEHWLAMCSSLRQEAINCELELDKAWMLCAHILPNELVREKLERDEANAGLVSSLGPRIVEVRNDFQRLLRRKEENLSEALVALRKRILALHTEVVEGKRLADMAFNEFSDDAENGDTKNFLTNLLEKLIQTTMDTFTSLCGSRNIKPDAALVEAYRNALRGEGENAMLQLPVTAKDKEAGLVLSQRDVQTISLILKMSCSDMDNHETVSNIAQSIYYRVQRILPHLDATLVRRAVTEVQQQKRERLRVRSVVLQYRKRSAELLGSFEKAIIAAEEIAMMQNAIDRETQVRKETKQKTLKKLERLRGAREEKDTARWAAEEAKRIEEEEKKQRILRIREIEFQERLRKLKDYQEQQRELEAAERALQQAIEEENALKKKLQQETNAKRVEERRKENENKCRLRKEHQQEVERLKVARKRTLESFFKGVDRRLGVKCDAERVLRHTVCSQQAVPFVSFTEASQFVMHGYTADDLIKDPRFRLQLALLEAGLHQTSYGREVLSRGFHVSAAQQPSAENPLRIEY